ncbi:hypothetical protein CYMTET_15066 [Cymbomonas tetramitiformis]|uniref:Uncharacterized protein n=1 Tax=Cymbomonas tetramitiformis TaxID=36881 RepID=A0AAE0GFA2_9CHLO|nr:hypothetical protein CYMTET_15066 [Cymbomonas tetramitiformis]
MPLAVWNVWKGIVTEGPHTPPVALAGKGGEPVLAAWSNKLLQVSLKTTLGPSPPAEGPETSREVVMELQCPAAPNPMPKGKEEKDVPATSTATVLRLSGSGRLLAVVWPHAHTYTIFQQAGAAWEKVESGTATDVVFATSVDRWAVLPPKPASVPEEKKKTPSKGKEAKAAAAAAEAVAAAATALYDNGVVVKELDAASGEVKEIDCQVGSEGGARLVTGLHAGELLGLALQPTQPGAPAGLVLFCWDPLREVGAGLPAPSWLQWDAHGSLCALVYSQHLAVFSTLNGVFQSIGQLELPGVTSVTWHRHQLFIATHTEVHVVYLSDSAILQSMKLAAFMPHAAIVSLPGTNPDDTAALSAFTGAGPAPVKRRIAGPLALLGVWEGALWVLDSHLRMHPMALAHPAVLCACLAAHGNMQVAASKAAAMLRPEMHDTLAGLMAGLGGASHALALPGLSKRMELEMALQAGPEFSGRALLAVDGLAAATASSQAVVSAAAEHVRVSRIPCPSRLEDLSETAPASIPAEVWLHYAGDLLRVIDAAPLGSSSARGAIARLNVAVVGSGHMGHEWVGALLVRLTRAGDMTGMQHILKNLPMSV